MAWEAPKIADKPKVENSSAPSKGNIDVVNDLPKPTQRVITRETKTIVLMVLLLCFDFVLAYVVKESYEPLNKISMNLFETVITGILCFFPLLLFYITLDHPEHGGVLLGFALLLRRASVIFKLIIVYLFFSEPRVMGEIFFILYNVPLLVFMVSISELYE